MRRYLFSGAENARDLGGYPISSAAMTAFGKIIRSDNFLSITPEEESFLLKHKFNTIVDLRALEEVEALPDIFYRRKNFSYYNAYLPEGNFTPAAPEDVAPVYLTFTGNFVSMQKVFKIIANTDGGVIFHCAAGKDRTGVVAALILLLAGVPIEDITADFLLSATYLYNRLTAGERAIPPRPMTVTLPRRSYMIDFLDLFHEKYGNVESYMKLIGITPEEISKIKDKLTQTQR